MVVALQTTAHAAAPALDLDWRAPVECPDRETVRRYVSEIVGSAEGEPAALGARGIVARAAPDRWTVDLALRTSSGVESRRSLEGPTCDSVTRAAALVMALAIHARDVPPPPVPRERETPPRPPRPVAGLVPPSLAVQIAADVGSVPSPTYGGELGFGWMLAGIRWEASGAYFAKQRGTVAGRDAVGADFTLAAVALGACYPLVDATVSLAPCARGGLDWVRASGFGSEAPTDGSMRGATVQAGGIFLWNLSTRLSTRLELDAVVPLVRTEFFVEGAGTVYRRTPVGLRAAAGLEVHF
ncbi:MAG TPA: hypothetical protein VF881_20725 [Polyangiaceae bacterium]